MPLTIAIVRRNLDAVIEQLSALGYKFDALNVSERADWALELRLDHAIAFVRARRGQKVPLETVLNDPDLSWIAEENIILPQRFYPHPQAPGIVRRDPKASVKIKAFETKTGQRVHKSLRDWFVESGAVDLSGSQPFLNPEHRFPALRIAPFEACAVALAGMWLPVWPAETGGWKVDVATGTLEDGRDLLEAIQHSLWWAGLPGWAKAGDPPEQELAFVRRKLEGAK
jgi:hypothetical protein